LGGILWKEISMIIYLNLYRSASYRAILILNRKNLMKESISEPNVRRLAERRVQWIVTAEESGLPIDFGSVHTPEVISIPEGNSCLKFNIPSTYHCQMEKRFC
jgi:hypothetical protein